MTSNPEFVAAVIAVLTGFAGLLTAITLYIKSKAEVGSIREERKATKEIRDEDSQKMHDDILKLQFQSQQYKDDIGLLFQQVADNNKQVALLTRQLSEVLVKMDSVIDTLKELKEDFKNGKAK